MVLFLAKKNHISFCQWQKLKKQEGKSPKKKQQKAANGVFLSLGQFSLFSGSYAPVEIRAFTYLDGIRQSDNNPLTEVWFMFSPFLQPGRAAS